MAKLWEYRPKKEELETRAALRFRAASAGFVRLAGRSLQQRGIDSSILSPARTLEDNEPGGDNAQFQRTVKRLTTMGMAPDEAVKQVRGYLDRTVRRTNAGMVRPRTAVQTGLETEQQSHTRPTASVTPTPPPSPGFQPVEYTKETKEAISQFHSDLAQEGYEPWMRNTQLRGQIRFANLLEEELDTRNSPPKGTPAYVLAEKVAGQRLEDEMGDLLREATPKPEKGLFGKVVGVAFTPIKIALSGMAAGIGELEKDPLLGGPFARTTTGQFPSFDPKGETQFERGASMYLPTTGMYLRTVPLPRRTDEGPIPI